MEAASAGSRQELEQERARLQRESSRLEALSAALGQERDDVRAQLALERGLLEDIRRGRHEERSRLLSEVTQVGRRWGGVRQGTAA